MAGDGILSRLAAQGIGSRMSRMLLPFIVVAPFALLLLVAWLENSGLMPLEHSRAVLAPALVLAMLSVVGWMGHRINDLEDELRYQSAIDRLTNVFNRRGFDAVGRHLARSAARRGTTLLVLFFDLDGLKRVNDTLGHEAGSELLRQFANALVETFRKSDVVARVGGDEFIVVADGEDLSVTQLLERLERTVATRNAGPDGAGISYSVGYTEVTPDAPDLDAAVVRADEMMYQHKLAQKTGRDSAEPQRPTGPAAIKTRVA